MLYPGPVRMYSELAPWFHLVTPPEDYATEAKYFTDLIEAARTGPADTLLELGSGGGNNASYLKQRFACTLTDLSEPMLELSRTINPECEHLPGDMRTLRLGRTFDVVFVHDAIMYMTTEHDLRAALETVAAHLRPGGVAVLAPDVVHESYRPGTAIDGRDGDDGRRLRYIEWTHEVAPGATTAEADVVILRRDGDGAPTRIDHEVHTLGVFPRATWLRLMDGAGLEPVTTEVEDPIADEHEVFVARRRHGTARPTT